jgi:hypothetical protein
MEDVLLTNEIPESEDGEFAGGEAPVPEATVADGSEFTEDAIEVKDDAGEVLAKLSLDSDLDELREEFPELATRESVTELDNPTRYASLRELGLTPREAYLATAKRAPRQDTRSHLSDSFHGTKAAPLSQMTRGELLTARELFSDLSDGQIHELYKKVR